MDTSQFSWPSIQKGLKKPAEKQEASSKIPSFPSCPHTKSKTPWVLLKAKPPASICTGNLAKISSREQRWFKLEHLGSGGNVNIACHILLRVCQKYSIPASFEYMKTSCEIWPQREVNIHEYKLPGDRYQLCVGKKSSKVEWPQW